MQRSEHSPSSIKIQPTCLERYWQLGTLQEYGHDDGYYARCGSDSCTDRSRGCSADVGAKLHFAGLGGGDQSTTGITFGKDITEIHFIEAATSRHLETDYDF
jgi:hypothetical protein